MGMNFSELQDFASTMTAATLAERLPALFKEIRLAGLLDSERAAVLKAAAVAAGVGARSMQNDWALYKRTHAEKHNCPSAGRGNNNPNNPGNPAAETERSEIVLTNEAETVDAIVRILGESPGVFQQGGNLVRVVTTPGGSAIRPANAYWMRDFLSQRIRLLKVFHRKEGDDYAESLIPEWLPLLVLERRDWPGVPELAGIVEGPVYLGGGRILASLGFDPESGLYCTSAVSLPGIPPRPTTDDTARAVEDLRELTADFPWASSPSPEAHFAAWLALPLTLAARFAIRGPCPYWVADASTRGSGKGLALKIASIVALGRAVAAGQASADSEEMRKAILPILAEGARFAWLDEAPAGFGGRAWNALVTSWPHYSDRILGKSERSIVPAVTVWATAGNNVSLRADSLRRAVLVRLEPQTDKPEEREDFRHPDLVAYALENHPRLLAAALTILRAYWAAGEPPSGLPPVGSFESWSRLVRDCVFWATGADPVTTQKALAAAVDEDAAALEAVLAAVADLFGENHFTAAELLDRLKSAPKDMSEAALAGLDTLRTGRFASELTPRAVGRILTRVRMRIVSWRRLHHIPRHGGASFRLEKLASGVSGVSGVSSPSSGEEMKKNSTKAEAPVSSGESFDLLFEQFSEEVLQ